MKSIKYFLYLLEIEPFWPILILILTCLSGVFPYKLKGKAITKKDKNNNTETTYYEYKDNF